MLRLIIRQIFKQWKALLPVALVWLVVGYFLFSEDHNTYKKIYITLFSVSEQEVPLPPDKHSLLVTLSRLFTDLPGPGQQDPEKAYSAYVKPALARLEEERESLVCSLPLVNCRSRQKIIRLDLMERACHSIPLRHEVDEFQYPPHWLERVKDWNLESRGAGGNNLALVEPSRYWKEKAPLVLASLQELVNALSYAYEIPPSVQEDPEKARLILLPELISRLSRAVCRKEMGILAWGDYAEFLEVRAFQKEEKLDPDLEEVSLYPAEREILLLESLKGDARYLQALREYAAGSISCSGASFSLSCYSPAESLKVHNKLLYFAPPGSRAEIYHTLGRLHASLALRSAPDKQKSHLEEALNFLS